MRSVLITGGAQGIGVSIVRAFLAEGAFVTVLDNDREAIGEIFGAFEGKTVRFEECDIADENEIVIAVESVRRERGGIDVLVNNAATAANGPLSRLSLEQWNRVIAVNLTAPMFLAKHCEKELRAAKGVIVNIASTRAIMSEPHTEAYSAAKGGIIALTHALAMSLAPDVRVNAVSPGWIEVTHQRKKSARTPVTLSEADHLQHPAGRAGEGDDIAAMVCYLASEHADFITGQNFVIDGGMTKKMIYV
jgi:NAD(P)-dependent dehydrogenase (short-subunit alcohol dehydrogenase family)